jgi:hypothetical protein
VREREKRNRKDVCGGVGEEREREKKKVIFVKKVKIKKNIILMI